MTPLELQDELVNEIGRVMDGCAYKEPNGNRIPINVFAQKLPKISAGSGRFTGETDDEGGLDEVDDDYDPVPYVIVRLNSGEDDGGRESFNTVSVVLVVGMWDEALDSQGHRDVMNVIQKIYQRFHENPNLNSNAVYAGGFSWVLEDDEYFPYSFGACQMKFQIAAVRREDYFA